MFAGHVTTSRGSRGFLQLRASSPRAITVYPAPAPSTTRSSRSWAEPDEDFTGFVMQTGQDVITLVTCIGGFSGGHYSNRLIVRGVRV